MEEVATTRLVEVEIAGPGGRKAHVLHGLERHPYQQAELFAARTNEGLDGDLGGNVLSADSRCQPGLQRDDGR